VNKREMLVLLEQRFEQPPQTLTGREVLAEVGWWDSLTVLAFLALADERFGRILEVDAVMKCTTLDDVLNLLGPIAKAA
jgi:hypothetical protein